MTPPGEVALHVFALCRGAGDAALLSADERARAARFRFERDRDRFIAGRAALRRRLGAALGRRPEWLAFRYGAGGKPSVEGGPHFNLSHTGDLAALVIGGFELGVDIERVRPIEADVARRFFAPDEVERLNALPPEQWQAGFYTCWTRKEAFIKATGEGLRRPLESFSVSLEPTRPARVLRVGEDAAEPGRWTLYPFVPAAGTLGAIAARHGSMLVADGSGVAVTAGAGASPTQLQAAD